jgi:hypothetical protein
VRTVTRCELVPNCESRRILIAPYLDVEALVATLEIMPDACVSRRSRSTRAVYRDSNISDGIGYDTPLASETCQNDAFLVSPIFNDLAESVLDVSASILKDL